MAKKTAYTTFEKIIKVSLYSESIHSYLESLRFLAFLSTYLEHGNLPTLNDDHEKPLKERLLAPLENCITQLNAAATKATLNQKEKNDCKKICQDILSDPKWKAHYEAVQRLLREEHITSQDILSDDNLKAQRLYDVSQHEKTYANLQHLFECGLTVQHITSLTENEFKNLCYFLTMDTWLIQCYMNDLEALIEKHKNTIECVLLPLTPKEAMCLSKEACTRLRYLYSHADVYFLTLEKIGIYRMLKLDHKVYQNLICTAELKKHMRINTYYALLAPMFTLAGIVFTAIFTTTHSFEDVVTTSSSINPVTLSITGLFLLGVIFLATCLFKYKQLVNAYHTLLALPQQNIAARNKAIKALQLNAQIHKNNPIPPLQNKNDINPVHNSQTTIKN